MINLWKNFWARRKAAKDKLIAECAAKGHRLGNVVVSLGFEVIQYCDCGRFKISRRQSLDVRVIKLGNNSFSIQYLIDDRLRNRRGIIWFLIKVLAKEENFILVIMRTDFASSSI